MKIIHRWSFSRGGVVSGACHADRNLMLGQLRPVAGAFSHGVIAYMLILGVVVLSLLVLALMWMVLERWT